jgi:hypothetical protein
MKREASAAGRWARFGIFLLVTLAAPRFAEAACTVPALDFGQLSPNCNGGYCYVLSPGSHTSETLAGMFWSFGSGNPTVGTGTDNGAWSLGNWLQPDGAKFWLGATWSASSAIDGCIAGSTAPGKPAEIMVASFSDQSISTLDPVGFFAVASARRVANAYPEFDFTFVAGGGLAHDINLVEMPRAQVVSSTMSTVVIRGPQLSNVTAGLYGDGSLAPGEVVKGYRIYRKPGRATSLRISDGWTAMTGTLPLGQISTVVWTPCGPGNRVSLGYTLVFDGDFETAHVGRPIQLVCTYCEDIDGDGYPSLNSDGECSMAGGEWDCNDLNANVNPEALEVCNGIDDNCDSAVDNASLPGSVAALKLEKQPGTTRIEWPSLPVAQRYDVVRGDLTTLLVTGGSYSAATEACVANDVTVAHIDDAEDPVPGGYGLWYLIRAANCTGVGSYNGPGASQTAPRDAGIAASGHACP